jgi:hypothetical protein
MFIDWSGLTFDLRLIDVCRLVPIQEVSAGTLRSFRALRRFIPAHHLLFPTMAFQARRQCVLPHACERVFVGCCASALLPSHARAMRFRVVFLRSVFA